MNKSIIILKNLTKLDYYHQNTILQDVSLDIEQNDSLTFTGTMNTGKSLLLKILGLIIDEFYAKKFTIFDYDINTINTNNLFILKKDIGFVFQNYMLFDSLNVEDNVGFFLKNYTKLSKKEIQEKVKTILEKMNLQSIEKAMIHELSGGMKKRISIARSIVYNPKILFLDEPTIGLDPINARSVIEFILQISRNFNITLISCSTDIHYIRKVSKHIGLIHNKKVELITREELDSPPPLFKQFIYGEQDGPIQLLK